MISHFDAADTHVLSNGFSRLLLRPFTFVFFLLFIPLLFGASEKAGSAQDSEQSPDDVLRIRTDLVTVPVSVTDAKGHRVSGLKQSDFSIRDNERAVTLSYFAAGTERVALAFVLDSSGSVRELVAQQREAALELFARFGRGSRVAVLHFGEKAELAVPFTTDTAVAQRAFTTHFPMSRRTAIFDAVSKTLHAFAAEKSDPAQRRILIVISDGLDTASVARSATVIRDARALNVSIYVIHLPLYAPRDGRLAMRPASKGFRDLASKTGGRYFLVGDAKSALKLQRSVPDVSPILRAIEEDLQGQYVLGYYPDDPARSVDLHRIKVGLNPRSGRKLRVRALREEYNLKQ